MTQRFIEQHYVKKGEVIDDVQLMDGLLVLTVFKQSTRTYKKVRRYKIAPAYESVVPPDALRRYHMTPRTKRQLAETHEVVQAWLLQGFIVHELTFNADGLTAKDSCYRIGPALLQAIHNEQQQQQQSSQQWEQHLFTQAEALGMPHEFKQLMDMSKLPPSWQQKKRQKFLEFCVAFTKLAHTVFDYKEIWAVWRGEIGGSKYFDQERESFLRYLEDNEIDVAYYGLVSIGKITPIYFTGDVTHPLACYKLGAVHATTDSAVLAGEFTTMNTTLWLVENRAILTRMATEVDFLRATNSCVVCLDGQLRSAHKQFIRQLDETTTQTIIWTDTDTAGITITKHAVGLVTGSYKIIGRNFEVFSSIEQYERAPRYAQEQEQQLGGVEQWRKWM